MRISASICSAWKRGDYSSALAMINNEDTPYDRNRERAFYYGRGAHKAWEEETKVTGKLPVIFKLPQFKVLGNEIKVYKQLTDEDWLVGKMDAIAEGELWGKKVHVIVDYKAGGKGDDDQVGIYHYLTHKHPDLTEQFGFNPEYFMYAFMNKLDGETHVEIVKLTMPENKFEWEAPMATTFTKGYNTAMTVLGEIKSHLGI